MPNTGAIFDTPHAKTQTVNRRRAQPFAAAIAIAVLAVVLAFLVLAPQSHRAGYVLKTWNEAKVTSATIKNIVSSAGVIELRTKDTILAPQTSQVSAVYVSEGDTVEKGQPIAKLVTTDLEWNLVVAQASYDEAVRSATMTDTEYEFSVRQQDITIKTDERNLKNAEDTLEQTQGLYDREIASASELATAKNSVADASDSLELARLTKEQTVAQHKITLSNRVSDLAQKKKTIDDYLQSIADCTIRSGIHGKVYTLSVAVGDRVSAYGTVAVVANPSDIQAGIDVAENRINDVKTGDPVGITIGSSVVRGTVKSISSSATTSSSSSSSTVRVVASFASIPSDAIVGGSISTDIQVGVIQNALTLPRGPYLSSGNYACAYVIDRAGHAVKKTVSFGITDGATIQVLSGLADGDRVITSAYQDFIHLAEIGLAK